MKTGEARQRYEEIVEVVETLEKGKKRAAGVIALTAVLLALATMMSHRTHTEAVIIEGERNTQWANYDRKRSVEHMYEADAKIAALLNGGQAVAEEFAHNADMENKGAGSPGTKDHKQGTDEIKKKAIDYDNDLLLARHRAFIFDLAELLLEMSLVLCSFSILQNSDALYSGSKIATVLGSFVFLNGFLILQWPALYPDKLFPS
jgi:hypothetical protein